MPEPVLPILEAHPGCAQAPTEGVLLIMHSHMPEFCAFPGSDPTRGEHALDRMLKARAVVVRKDVR
jgi:hypothetical protein